MFGWGFPEILGTGNRKNNAELLTYYRLTQISKMERFETMVNSC